MVSSPVNGKGTTSSISPSTLTDDDAGASADFLRFINKLDRSLGRQDSPTAGGQTIELEAKKLWSGLDRNLSLGPPALPLRKLGSAKDLMHEASGVIDVAIVLSTDAVTVVEGGSCGFYEVCLSQAPSADVTIEITDDAHPPQVVSEPRVLKFSPENDESKPFCWRTPQLVRLSAIDDDESEDTGVVTMVHRSMSLDERYSSEQNPDLHWWPPTCAEGRLRVNIEDNDGKYVFTFGDLLGPYNVPATDGSSQVAVSYMPRRRNLDKRARKEEESQQKKKKTSRRAISSRGGGSQPSSGTGRISLGKASIGAAIAASGNSRKPPKASSLRACDTGGYHSAVLHADGRVFFEGSGIVGQACGSGGESSVSAAHSTTAAAGRTNLQELTPWDGTAADGSFHSTIKEMACGLYHTALVDDAGKLLMSGSDAFGQLGLSRKAEERTAAASLDLGLMGGRDRSGALTRAAWSVGTRPQQGRHGPGGSGGGSAMAGQHIRAVEREVASAPHTPIPRLVESLRDERVLQVSCGDFHSAAVVTRNGARALFTWGMTGAGALGNGFGADVGGVVLQSDRKAAKRAAAAALMSLGDGSGKAMPGEEAWGRMCDDEERAKAGIAVVSTPTRVAELDGREVYRVACGSMHTAVLCSGGELLTTGWAAGGRLGRSLVPANAHHSCRFSKAIVLADPSAAGTLGLGELGDDMDVEWLSISAPVTKSRRELSCTDVACGGAHTGVITEDRGVFCCGSNEYGQLGLGDVRERRAMRRVKFLERFEVSVLSFGFFHSACITSDGNLYVWGCNDQGQLGLGVNELMQTLPRLHVPLVGVQAVQVSCGRGYTSVLTQFCIEHVTLLKDEDEAAYHRQVEVFRRLKEQEDRRLARKRAAAREREARRDERRRMRRAQVAKEAAHETEVGNSASRTSNCRQESIKSTVPTNDSEVDKYPNLEPAAESNSRVGSGVRDAVRLSKSRHQRPASAVVASVVVERAHS